ncbi:transcriptional repressor [Sulfitobacter sp. M57]|uniref:transcriptional repressor n=1 Tax=unclassified Sulfitobacter TaxID=196795 RepID=UPI0023E17945|nr:MULTISPECIES: transcriptional repressor [unclassified Sulfitobacter]MDF3413392.1 transcriptional repressor [Sulfitobacter sp. KE5]MDF3421328.1 transcriptional repressor [Sulfitobacter sp. KE43]MDF3431939.1 transcriptional repressor [Sulfitobacter sp. KE42]MDF3457579.1 transcriptional repressor [Sulfitobacter sp. S74]MDF3461481.1 transcriptional repressor [Sulfitobacter sp. Ks18]
MNTIGFAPHDHGNCVADTLRKAEQHCADNGLRLTPVRRRSLEILLADHRALGAYDLLAVLATEGLGAQPPVAYRALDFLVKAGFAHKIEALNAYIACAHLGECQMPAFLICRACNSVAETDTTLGRGRLNDAASDAGFRIERTVVEAEGLCPSCQKDTA